MPCRAHEVGFAHEVMVPIMKCPSGMMGTRRFMLCVSTTLHDAAGIASFAPTGQASFSLLKPQKIRHLPLGVLLPRHGMFGIEKLHHVKPTLVHIEVDIPGLKIGGKGLPDLCLRVAGLDGLPGCLTHAPAVAVHIHIQQKKLCPAGCL